eukprot:10762075-Alexandrium_andersonii.AAC.1
MEALRAHPEGAVDGSLGCAGGQPEDAIELSVGQWSFRESRERLLPGGETKAAVEIVGALRVLSPAPTPAWREGPI